MRPHREGNLRSRQMKLLTSKNIQFIALTVLGMLVFLAVSRYLYKEGFQSGGDDMMSNPAIQCKGYQLAIDGKTREMEASKNETDRDYIRQFIEILEKKKLEMNCANYADKMAEIPTPLPVESTPEKSA